MNITSLTLADNIYQDHRTGKYILSGVYHQIDVPEIPYRLPFLLRAYCAFERPKNDCNIEFILICEEDKTILAGTDRFTPPEDDSIDFIQLDMEFPPIGISIAGNYSIGVKLNGIVIKKAPFKIVFTNED